MSAEQHLSHGGDSSMRGRIRDVLDDCLRRRSSGEDVDDEALIAAHPDLMPKLGDELRKLRIIAGARARAKGPSEADNAPTIEHRSSKKDSRGLHIRCPHCSNPVEVVSDTPYDEICCSSCGSSFSLVMRDESTRMAAPLKSIGRFDLISRLGLGGFGTVWKARDRELDRVVAVKIPRRGQLSPAEIDQFFREARAAAQLRHPNIVPVYEVGRDGDTLFIVSDIVRGVTLSDWLTGNRPAFRDAAELCIPVAEALHHAHEQGVIHRDLKPSNIMIDEAGQPHLTDFGLAKREVGEITMTADGQILGTPAYMSPEQAAGEGHWTDRRTDVYSLGVVLFQLLTGELPFRGNAQMQVHQRLTEDAPDPRKLNRHIPRDLSTICLKCLERDPNRRFATGQDMADELGRYLQGEPIRSRPISRTERALRWSTRNPALAAASVLTAFLAIAGPTSALIIETQRRRLDELNLENKHVIAQQASEHEADTSQIKKLRESLDVWEGRANPWELWPPDSGTPPRKSLMARVAGQGAALEKLLQQAGDDQQRVHVQLALAVMNDALGRTYDAVRHYQAARDLLAQLASQNPAATQYAVALADCNFQLARLKTPTDRAGAMNDAESGRLATRNLADKNHDPRLRAGWFEAELNAAVLAGIAGAVDNLHRAQQIGEDFQNHVPQDSIGLYELACYLADREPLLMTRKTADTTNAAP